MNGFDVLKYDDSFPIKMWTKGVHVEEQAKKQLKNLASLPFIHKHLAVMPDVHLGRGSTIGSVIPTKNAIIPAAVGVDLGCGMMAVKTTLKASDLPDNLGLLRWRIESVVPHGRTDNGGLNDRGRWGNIPDDVKDAWNRHLSASFKKLCEKDKKFQKSNNVAHLGTLGGGNHFIEICLDEADSVWVMLHSGSRGIGNKIGSHFIKEAKKDMKRWFINLPDQDLAYFPQGSENFGSYVGAVAWAQNFARINREIMMDRVLKALSDEIDVHFEHSDSVINCHHNYIAMENHFGENVWITRKGAVRARLGDMGIIPGAMGRKSFIVRGKGNKQSFSSCSHGAGRMMSRTEARKRFSVEDHVSATEGLECRKDSDVIDETPMAYKNIDDVMKAQEDLVEIVHTLRAVVCVKG